jgi:hypothetical protein
MHAKARDPVRRARIAAPKLGKPRPPDVMVKLRKANLGRKLSAEHRRKQSEAHKTRGTRPPWLPPPWTAEEDKLLAQLPAADVARRTKRSLGAVYSRRSLLGLPDARRRSDECN